MGYDAKWGIVGAHHVAAPHKRDRIWLVANSKKLQRDGSNHNAGVGMESEQVPKSGNNCGKVNVANTRSERGQLSVERKLSAIEQYRSDGEARSLSGIAGEWWATEPDVGRVAHGVANRVDRLKAIGNGQVPQAAALAWKILTGDRLNSCENT
jgi:DNA (cytosine-5)-methyltransferase 1